MPTDPALIVFVKYPEVGQVKTRLAATIGAELACELYSHFIEVTLRRAASFPLAVPFIFFTPEQSREAFREQYGPEFNWVPQLQSPDLGARMEDAIARILALGHRRVIVLGSDSPDLPTAFLEEAVRALDDHDLVLGPSEDGGYYLIAVKKEWPDLFRGISWSTDQVFGQTVAAVNRLGLSLHLLPKWYDVDDLDSLRRYYDSAAIPSELGRKLRQLLR